MKRLSFLAFAVLMTTAAQVQAQPQPVPQPPGLPDPQDIAWPGTITLVVDATDVDRHIVTVQETIPVQPGGLTLLYPRFIPGEHGPSGPLGDLAGLAIEASSQPVAWQRDVVDMNAFHLVVPGGVTSLEVRFQYLSPVSEREGRVEMTPELLDLAWNTVVLYPAGVFTRGITVQPSLKLPSGWQFASALDGRQAAGTTISFAPVTLETLVDSPVYAGLYFSRLDLDPGAAVPVYLNIVADRPEDLAISPDQLARHRALVRQAIRTFGSHHYDHYDFLLALSGQLGGKGLEHHRSSENAVGRDYFTNWDRRVAERDLLPHEYTHSWNGKFRRPADLWAPNFSVPQRDSLLWVYEGQTQFWGQVLAARSGLWTREQALDAIALDAAGMETQVGRAWRPLQDTTNDPIINRRRPLSWSNWQRTEDYYTEGLLVWLDADTLIRERTHGQKSLNDFARAFFGINDGSFVTIPYTFDDVAGALNGVLPYDWAAFLRSRLDGTGGAAPLDGLARGGYRLVYTDRASDFLRSLESRRKTRSFDWSVGLRIGEGGQINGVVWDSPAFRAGAVRGGRIIAVNGLAYGDADDLAAAIKLAQGSAAQIELLVRDGNHFRTLQIDYHGGARYPHLARIAGTPAVLDDILAPLN